ncbi:hypothetical protein SMKI_15G2470 [Saccharomyces mikatae IFO 1815]|uniref:Nup1p n=1 Tax=Saccharomyces mikatae IFO 1815 TaxID=226126 RepID=A0AA35NFB4_SACMI|nr:uncharacterized protein SMKI_15G2470 [Saccharomyces mikatae IFO 1815]CAI4036404.1 hypothetical protein SMKI_15G2470 [Saccharomyces mikatae IFO 1815]
MPASTASVMSSPRVGKRSFSSTIKSFFTNSNNKQPSNKKVSYSNLPYSNHSEESDVGNTLHVKKRKRMPGTLQHSESLTQDKNNAPIIIYGTDDTERPPVLPILPIQRLRLLREKQRLRNAREFNLLQSTRSPSVTSSVILDHQSKTDDKDSYLRTSSTPSPVRKGSCIELLVGESDGNTTVRLPMLKSLKNRTNRKRFQGQSKGAVWSVNFEYDLSEYDAMHEKDHKSKITDAGGDQTIACIKNNSISNDLNGNVATNPKPTSEIEELRSDINSNRLSNPQKTLLLNGPASVVAKSPAVQDDSVHTTKLFDTPILKKIVESKKDKESIVLPTIGFDFIKDNETPSKKTSPTTSSSAGAVLKSSSTIGENNRSTDTAQKSTLSFNFGKKSSEPKAAENSVPSSTLFNLSGISDSASLVNKPFTFEKPLEKDGERTKREILTFSSSKPECASDITSKSTASAFAFGKHKSNSEQGGSIGDDDNGPRRKRRAPVNEDTNSGPLFDVDITSGHKDAKEKEPENVTSEKPSFLFSSHKKQHGHAPSFVFGKESDQTNKPDSSAPFTFDKAAIAKEASANPTQIPPAIAKNSTFTFGQSKGADKTSEGTATSAVPFYKPTEKSKSASTSASAVKPSFSFTSKPADAQASADNSSSKATFSFTGPPQEDPSIASEQKKPSFMFASSSKSAQQKPLFSFGKPDTAKESLGAKASFDFTKSSNQKTDEKVTTPSFAFGGPATNHIKDTNTKPSFNFGAPGSIKESASLVAGSTENISNGFSFTKFNENKEKSVTPTSFFNRSTSSTPVPVLGKPATDSNNATSKSAFSFGTVNTDAANASANSTSFSFNAPTAGNGTTTTANSKPGTSMAGGFNLEKPGQNIINSSSNGGGSGFNFSRPGTVTNGVTSDQSSINTGSNGAGGLNPFTSVTTSSNTTPFNKPPPVGTQNISAPSNFSFTGNSSAPGAGSVFNMNNANNNTVFGGSNTHLPHQSHNALNTNNSFTPSTVPNINFGGFNGGIANTATGSLKPSDIFGGNSVSSPNPGALNSSSLFGGQGMVSNSSFGQPQLASNQMGMGANNGMNMGMHAGSGNVMANRKIARMRHSKR